MKTFLLLVVSVLIFLLVQPLMVQAQNQQQSVLNGSATAPVNLDATTTCVYNWAIDNPDIGLAPSGTGTVPSFTAINNTSAPITATITVTPKPVPTRAYIPSQATNKVSVLDVATNTVIAKIPVGRKPYGVAISPDNSRVYVTNSGDNSVSEIDAASNRVIRTFQVNDDPRGIVVSPDGSIVYVACYGVEAPNLIPGTVLKFNVSLGTTTVLPVTITTRPVGLAISPDGGSLYIGEEGAGRLFNTLTNRTTISPSGVFGTDVRFNPDGSKIYGVVRGDLEITNGPGTILSGSIYNFTTQTSTYLPNKGSAFCVTASPDVNWLYATIPDENKVSVFDVTTSTVTNNIPLNPQIKSIPVGINPQGIAATPGGLIYVLNNGSNDISIFDADPTNNVVVKTISTGDAQPFAFGDFITHNACTSAPFTITITINPTPPAIIASGTPDHLTTPANIPSPSTSFNVAGVNLTDGILVTPPAGFEVSTDDENFSPAVTVGASGDTPPTPVYLRLKINLPAGNYPGNITLSSPAVTDVTVPVSGTVTPAMQNITTGTLRGSITACMGEPSASPKLQQFTVSGELLIDDITATAPAGFEVSLAADDGYGLNVVIRQTGGTVTNRTIYVRSAASASGSITGDVALTSSGAIPRYKTVNGFIDEPPRVDPVVNNNQVLNAGTLTSAVNFTGTASTYTWVNDNPGIGLPATGGGNIAPFIAKNTTPNQLIAHITVTPVNAPLAYVTNQGVNSISVINTSNSQIVANIPVGEVPYATVISPDGGRVFVADQGSNIVSVIDAHTNTFLFNIQTGTNPSGLAITPNGSTLYIANGSSNNVSVINLQGYSGLNTYIDVGISPEGIVASPDGKWIYVANRNSDNVSVISTAINQVIATVGGLTSPEGLAISPDGGTLYVTNYNGRSVSAINTLNYQKINIPVGVNPHGIAVSPDGNKIYVTNWGTGTVSVIDAASHDVAAISVGTGPEGISITPDGRSVYVANTTSGTVSVISTLTSTVTTTVTLPGSPVSFGSFIAPATGCSGTPVTFQITVNPPVSVITATGTLPPLTTTYGTPSSAASLRVSGVGLTGVITVKPPDGFEASTDNVVFKPQVVIGAPGTVAVTPVYFRLAAATVVGAYPGNVTFSSLGAPDVQVPAANSTVNPATLTIKADDKIKEPGAANPVLTATYTGFVNNETTGQLSALPALSTTAGETSPAGEYPISVNGAEAVNYTFVYVAGVLTIKPSEEPLVIPNAFTPNNDGINDTWVIKNLDTYTDFTIGVFNRNGERLFFSNRYPAPWDGRYKGAKLPAGTYYYVIDLHTGDKPLAGPLTIIR